MKLIKIMIFVFMAGSIAIAEEVNDFRLKDLNNKIVSFEDLKGDKLTVLDFWATWCKPCVKSVPELIELYEKFKSRGVEFIGINIDSPRNKSKVKPFVRSLGIKYPVLLDTNNELMSDLGITAIPTLLIVDKKGKVLVRHEGFKSGEEKLIGEELKKALAAER